MSLIYRVINPIVKTILKSPAHGVLSHNTLLLRYQGRKSGQRYELPISYARSGDQIFGFTARKNRWWLNLQGGVAIELLLAGDWVFAHAQVETHDLETITSALAVFLLAVPRDAKPSGVRLAADGSPDASDLKAAAQRLVALRLIPADTSIPPTLLE